MTSRLERAMSAKNIPTWRPLNGVEECHWMFWGLVFDHFQFYILLLIFPNLHTNRWGHVALMQGRSRGNDHIYTQLCTSPHWVIWMAFKTRGTYECRYKLIHVVLFLVASVLNVFVLKCAVFWKRNKTNDSTKTTLTGSVEIPHPRLMHISPVSLWGWLPG